MSVTTMDLDPTKITEPWRTEPDAPPPELPRPKQWGIPVVIGLLLLGVFGIWQLLQTPSVGTTIGHPPPATTKSIDPVNWIPLSSQYYNFSYPSTFRFLNHNHYPGALEGNQLVHSYSNMLVITVAKPESFADSVGLKIRNEDPKIYRKTTRVVGGSTAQIFYRDTTEITAYIPKGNLVTIIALTDANPNPKLSDDFAAMLKTFSWK